MSGIVIYLCGVCYLVIALTIAFATGHDLGFLSRQREDEQSLAACVVLALFWPLTFAVLIGAKEGRDSPISARSRLTPTPPSP